MLFNIIKVMTKKPEDMTLDEIRAQMALFSRVYYHKRKEEDPEYIEKVRERKRITGKALYHKKKAQREARETEERRERGEPEPESQIITRAENTKQNMRWLLSLIENNDILMKVMLF